jgi:CRP-like cAMP-binding protein
MKTKGHPAAEHPADPPRDAVLAAFSNHFPEYPELGEGFAGICGYSRHRKGEILKGIASDERWIALVLEGSAGVFVSRAKREVCLDLSLPGDFLVDWESLVTQEPSGAVVRTLEASLIARVGLPGPGCERHPDIDRLLQGASSFMFLDRQQRLVSMLTETPAARYRRLEKRNPRLVRGISSTVLASWLGITREHLSRIRSGSAQ